MKQYGVTIRLPTGLNHKAKEWRYKSIVAETATDAGNQALYRAAHTAYWKGANPELIVKDLLTIDEVWRVNLSQEKTT